MENKALVTYLKKAFFTGTFKTVVVTLSTIFFLPLIISKVGLQTYGLISLTMIFGGMVVFADFGVSKSVTLLIGQDKDKKNVNNIIINALVINISILLLIGIILYLLVLFNIPLLGSSININDKLKNYVVLVGYIGLSIMLINNLLTAILESYYLMHYVNIGFMISSVLINALIYLFSIISNSVYILLLAPTISFFIVTIYFITIIKLHTDVSFGKISIKQIKTMLGISYKFLNIGLVNSLVIPINKYMIVYLTGNTSILALFDIGLKISLIANSFLNSIAQPLFGVFSNITKNKEKIYQIALKVSFLLFVLYIIGNILFYFIGLQIVRYIDASHSEILFKITFILLLGVSFTSISEPFYRALLGTGRLKVAFRLKLLVPILNILLYYILYFFNYQRIYIFVCSYSSAVFIASLSIIIYYTIKYRY